MRSKYISKVILFVFCFSLAQPLLATEYSLAPIDTLSIQILNKKELNIKQTVAPDGTVSLPLIGRVNVTTHTLTSFQNFIEKEYAKYFKNPNIVLTVIPRPIYIVEKDGAGQVVNVKEAKTINEAKALTANSEMDIKYGDIVTVETKAPIYVVQHNVAKNTWDVKVAKSLEEAKAYAGKGYLGEIKHGDMITVEVGKQPDWLEDNWYKVITGVSVVIGVVLAVGK
jgi:hypothetical protein